MRETEGFLLRATRTQRPAKGKNKRDFDPAQLAQLVVDTCKANPLPSVLVALLLLFLVRHNPKNMAKLTLLLVACGYTVHLLSGMTVGAAAQQDKGYTKSANLIDKNDR